MAKFNPKGFSGTAGGKFGITVRGYQAAKRKLKAYEKISELKSFMALKKSLIILEAEMKRLIKSGYYKPAIDTGRMRMSVGGQIVSFEPTKAEGKVGTNVYYSIYVHEGTKFMEPRPFATDALKNKEDQIKALFKEAYKYDLGFVG